MELNLQLILFYFLQGQCLCMQNRPKQGCDYLGKGLIVVQKKREISERENYFGREGIFDITKSYEDR